MIHSSGRGYGGLPLDIDIFNEILGVLSKLRQHRCSDLGIHLRIQLHVLASCIAHSFSEDTLCLHWSIPWRK